MASKRMFSQRFIDSAKFQKMPKTSQLLYFYLALHADDDGVVEAYNIIRFYGMSEDDFKILVAKGFVQVLNEDLVSYITDWTEHNKIRADRKVDSLYQNLLIEKNPGIKLVKHKPRSDVKKAPVLANYKVIEQKEIPSNGQPTDGPLDGPMDNQWTDHGRSNGQPMDGIGKDRLGKYSIEKEREKEREKNTSRDRLAPSDKLKESVENAADERAMDWILNRLNQKLPSRKGFALDDETRLLIKKLLDKGYILADFGTVIDKKAKEWLGTKMQNQLKPRVLFGEHFDEYLRELEVPERSSQPKNLFNQMIQHGYDFDQIERENIASQKQAYGG